MKLFKCTVAPAILASSVPAEATVIVNYESAAYHRISSATALFYQRNGFMPSSLDELRPFLDVEALERDFQKLGLPDVDTRYFFVNPPYTVTDKRVPTLLGSQILLMRTVPYKEKRDFEGKPRLWRPVGIINRTGDGVLTHVPETEIQVLRQIAGESVVPNAPEGLADPSPNYDSDHAARIRAFKWWLAAVLLIAIGLGGWRWRIGHPDKEFS